MQEILTMLWARYNAQLVSFFLSLVAAFIFWLSRAKPRLRWGIQHGFAHSLRGMKDQNGDPAPIVTVYTMSLLFMNLGRAPAQGVEVTLNYQPTSFAIWPERQFGSSTNPSGKLVIRFDSMAPKERLSINILMVNTETPAIMSVRSEDGSAKEIGLQAAPVFSKTAVTAIWSVLFLGAVASVYLLISVIALFAQIGS